MVRCKRCNKRFATKYTLKRHLTLVHAGSHDRTPDSESIKGTPAESVAASVAGDIDDDTSETSESEDDASEVNNDDTPKAVEEDDTSEEESSDDSEDEEEDFWKLLIRATVKEIQWRIIRGLPVPVPAIYHVDEFLEESVQKLVLKVMFEKYHEHEKMVDAAERDKLLDVITSKMMIEMQEFEKFDEEFDPRKDHEEYKKQAQLIAWKKFKYLIKKQIVKHIDEFEVFVDGNDSGVEKMDSVEEMRGGDESVA